MAQVLAILIATIFVISGILAVVASDESDNSDKLNSDLSENEQNIDDKCDGKKRDDFNREKQEKDYKKNYNGVYERKEQWNDEFKNNERMKEIPREDIQEHERIIKELKRKEKEVEENIEITHRRIKQTEMKIDEYLSELEELEKRLRETESERTIKIKEKIERIENEISKLKRGMERHFQRIDELNVDLLNIRREIKEHFEIIEKLKNKSNPQRESVGINLMINWGYLDEKKHRNNDRINWDGGIYITNGKLKLIKSIKFENNKNRRVGDLVNPQISPNHVSWQSSTTVHWDGILIHIEAPIPPPIERKEIKREREDIERDDDLVGNTDNVDGKRAYQDKDWNGEQRKKNSPEIDRKIKQKIPTFVIIKTRHWSGVFTLQELRNINKVISIDDLGHEIALKAVEKPQREIEEQREKKEQTHIFVDTEIFSEEDNIANDVFIRAFINDKPVSNAKVLIDDKPVGETNERGTIEALNLRPGGHHVFITNRESSGETKFFIEENKQMIFLKFETFDDDGDGLNDDVMIKLFDNFEKPIPKAKINVDEEFEGYTDERGGVTFFDFIEGDHYIFVNYNDLFIEAEFYSEGFEDEEFEIIIEVETFENNAEFFVFNQFGDPIGGAIIHINDDYYGCTNFEGFFEVFYLESGEYFVEVQFWEHYTNAEFYIGEEHKMITMEIDVFNDENGGNENVLHIKVIDIDGEPIAGAKVFVNDKLLGSTNYEGIFEAFIFYEGEYFVEVIWGDISLVEEFKI